MVLSGVSVLRNDAGEPHGIVRLLELEGGGCKVAVTAWGLSPGNHGFHIHRSGNETGGSHTLCAHYNPFGKSHGDLNDPGAHAGDLGNLFFESNGECTSVFVADQVSLSGPYSVLGRSFVIHADPDDLGLGSYPDSKTTGHSGDRVLYGVIGIDEPCE